MCDSSEALMIISRLIHMPEACPYKLMVFTLIINPEQMRRYFGVTRRIVRINDR